MGKDDEIAPMTLKGEGANHQALESASQVSRQVNKVGDAQLVRVGFKMLSEFYHPFNILCRNWLPCLLFGHGSQRTNVDG